MLALKIVGFILIIVGAIINYCAKPIADKMKLAERLTAHEASDFSDDEVKEYKLVKAKVRVKLIGLAFFLPGVLLLFFSYR